MGCFRLLLFYGLLALGIGSVWLLVRIHGTSDGPGALFIYITAILGLGGACAVFSTRARRS